jgi:hypothetical protein
MVEGGPPKIRSLGGGATWKSNEGDIALKKLEDMNQDFEVARPSGCEDVVGLARRY